MPIRITERRHFNPSNLVSVAAIEALASGIAQGPALAIRVNAGLASSAVAAALDPTVTGGLGCSIVQLTGTDPYTGASITRIQDLAGATLNARIDAASTANIISLEPGTTYHSSDFAAGTVSGIIPSYSDAGAGLIGTGVGSSIIQMDALTSTHAGDVPTTGTNQIYVGEFNRDGLMIRCLTFQGNDQNHDFNGLRFDGVANGVIANVKLIGMSEGSNFFPPGETFGLNNFNGSNWVYQDVEYDGRFDGATGSGVAASGFGDNSFSGGTWTRCYAHHCFWSASWAMWQGSGNLVLRDCQSDFSRSNLGFERMGGEIGGQRPACRVDVHNFSFGQYIINGPQGTGQDIFLGNDQGSTQLWFYDPVLKPGRTTASGRDPSKAFIFFPVNEQGNPNLQQKADVHVVINGVEVPNTNFFQFSR